MAKIKAFLVLATGRVFEGWHFGAPPQEKSFGEVVFNTSLTGYQEILTDPSYAGQIVAMTAPHIGNYGVNADDVESRKIYLSGFIVQELSQRHSNWRAESSLETYLLKAGVTGVTGVDTRALTRHLRTLGSVNGLISSDQGNIKALIKKAKSIPSMEGLDFVKQVTSPTIYKWEKNHTDENVSKNTKKNVVVMDFGVKENILRCLDERNCNVTVVPADTPSSEILNLKPDGVMLSNGPGDPATVNYGIETIQDLIAYNKTRQSKGEKPFAIFGICLGHQVLSLALGAKTFKLKFGHHGANHPIKDIETGKVDITTQNHGFAVEPPKNNDDIVVTHINLNDQSVAGIRHPSLPIFSVQYHPEASAGPHDARHLFDRFSKLMELGTHAKTN